MGFPLLGLATVLLAACGGGERTETDEISVHDPREGAGGAGGDGGASGNGGAGGVSGSSGASGVSGAGNAQCQPLPAQARLLTQSQDVFDGYTPLSVTNKNVIFNTNPTGGSAYRQVYSIPLSGGEPTLHTSPSHEGVILPSAIGDAVAFTSLKGTLFGDKVGPRMVFGDVPNTAYLVLGDPLFSDLMGVPADQLTYGPSSLGRTEFPGRYRMAVAVTDGKKSAAEGGKDIAIVDFKLTEPDDIDVEGVTKITVANGHIYNPTLSPNGRFLAYWRTQDDQETIEKNAFPDKPGSFQLVLRNLDDGGEKVVQPFIQPERLDKSMRYIQRLSVSDNGDIAYGVQLPTQKDVFKTHVLIYHADTGKIEDIGLGETPSMSRDGGLLVYEKLETSGQGVEGFKFSLALRGVKTGMERLVSALNVGTRCDLIPAIDASGQNLVWFHYGPDYDVATIKVSDLTPDTDADGVFDLADPCPTKADPMCK